MLRIVPFLLIAGCAGHRYRFQPEISDSRTEFASLSFVARKGVVHVFNATTGAVSTVDPSLRTASAGEGATDAGDVDEDGLWVWQMTRVGPAHRKLGTKSSAWMLHRYLCASSIGYWTRSQIVFHCPCHESVWIPKRPTGDDRGRRVENDGEIDSVAVDYAHDRLWASRSDALVTLGPADAAWAPVRIDATQYIDRPASLVFGAHHFAFLSAGVVYAGAAEGATLRVIDRIEPPEPVRRISFNAADEDVLCLWTADAVWAWDLESGESVRFKCTWPFAYVDFRHRRVLGIQGDTAFSAKEDGSDLRTTRLPK